MKISVIIPVYNSEKILNELIVQLKKNLSDITDNYEIILVNDFSKDKSWNKICELAKNNSFLKGLNLIKNHGQHNAIFAGLNYAKGDFFILMDDDLQHDPNSINKIVNELINGSDACYVKYLKRKHVLWKKFVSWLNNITVSILVGKSTKIYTSSFKGFNKKIKNFIISSKEIEIFIDWPIIGNASKISVVEVFHKNRLYGETNYNLKNLLLLWSTMIYNIKAKSKFSFLLLIILKFLIKNILYKLIEKRDIRRQFIISAKTFEND